MMRYKGYSGKAEYDDDAETFHGEVIGTNDVVTFQGKSVDELKEAFRESVDEYLDFCKRMGREPEKTASGKLILRLPAPVHSKAASIAKKKGKSLNAWLSSVIEKEIEKAQ